MKTSLSCTESVSCFYIYSQCIKTKQNIKYNSCVLWFYTSQFHTVSLLFHTTLPVLSNFFWIHHCRTLQAVLETIFSQQLELLHHMWNEFLWDVSWELRTTKIKMVPNWAVRRVWNNFKSDALYCRWRGNTSVGSSVTMLKMHWLLSLTNMNDCFNFFRAF